MTDAADWMRDMFEKPQSKPEPRPQRRMRAIVSNHQVDYAHNDVANAAWFFKDRLSTAIANGERSDGIFLQLMATVTMTAFALEGYVSFIGRTLLERGHKQEEVEDVWKRFDKNNTRNKIKVIRRLTGAKIDWNKRPYVTVRDLINLRHQFVHPKAHHPEQREFEALGTEDELKRMLREYRPEYELRLTWEFVQIAYDDVEEIWKDLLAAAKIEAHETWSGGMQGLEFIEHVDDVDL